jgi:DeoR/GlpR family transcriptional regulator of sugar metabolism
LIDVVYYAEYRVRGIIKEQRFEKIKAELVKQGNVSANDMAALLDVSLATVRRDLDALETPGVLCRTHGGAKAVEDQTELPFHSKTMAFQHEKRRIGVEAAALSVKQADVEVVVAAP